MAIHMFQQLIDTLKKSPKRIVFTEGTDARILEASARLLAGTWLAPILIGNDGGGTRPRPRRSASTSGVPRSSTPPPIADMDKMVEEMVALRQRQDDRRRVPRRPDEGQLLRHHAGEDGRGRLLCWAAPPTPPPTPSVPPCSSSRPSPSNKIVSSCFIMVRP